MKSVMKNTAMITGAAVIALSIIGCGDPYSAELIQEKVIKQQKMAEKYDVKSFDYEFLQNVELGDMELSKYKYKLVATATQDECRGMVVFGQCRGQLIKAGDEVTNEGTVTMNPMDVKK